ncbi:MAG: terminase small subunit [Synergistaceae bacterium]|nr:terminase small subunit [Synergistaceae bacterium]MBR1603847.1 terminase small subunit [Synergistaceae bacterium]
MALTAKQRAFIEYYTGNAAEAAIKAGYSKDSAYTLGQRLMNNAEVIAEIKAREAKRLEPDIATREERFKFWTRAMRDEDTPMKERLKASELLGKAEGDFLERVEMEHTGSLDIRGEVRLRLLELMKEKRDSERKQADND